MSVKIITLIENNADENSYLCNEHGLSFYIETDKLNIIFDTGQSGNFVENASKLNVDLKYTDYVILSHGHYDHSGGFRKLVKEIENSFQLIISEKFFNLKYIYKQQEYIFIGNSFNEKYLEENKIKIKFINEDIFYLSENILIISNFERKSDFEKICDRFYIKEKENYIKDDFSDEIAVAVKLKEGLLVILGCSHIGVVNILETIIERTGIPIYGVVGGTHLIEADRQRLESTISFLKENNIHVIGVSHCTGENAVEKMQQEFQDKFIYNSTGNIMEFTDI